MSSAARKKTAPLTPGREQGERLGSSESTLPRRQRKPAISYAYALKVTPDNTQTGTQRGVDNTTRIVDLTLGELLNELLAAQQVAAEPREVLDSAQAADVLGISTSTLWRLVRAGCVRPRIVSGSRRYLRAELLEFVRGAEVPHA
jgi:predicted DNA-binding transcriptional regulator AlpA